MPLKPGKCYRYFSGPAYTRREFVDGVPGSRITFFDMGNPNGNFPVEVSLVAQEQGQIRHNALEAARMAANRLLETKVGRNNYHFKIRLYPHQILRDHPMALGAGADRVSEGMRLAFGRPIGTAARIKPEQKLMTVRVPEQFLPLAKEALERAKSKLPLRWRMVVEKTG
ncbi:MAG: 50S ribosomal protein L16 [Hadesarchaea archaeon]|nr:MAG: 50S ribosomal protein L16 [Hadesarchaea archaeon]TDA32883.1 MAG: 50S ribosomal protein L16 [Hadesarchaea archaeon]